MGNRMQREFVDRETGDQVERDEQFDSPQE
jgi:hypothetical protein